LEFVYTDHIATDRKPSCAAVYLIMIAAIGDFSIEDYLSKQLPRRCCSWPGPHHFRLGGALVFAIVRFINNEPRQSDGVSRPMFVRVIFEIPAIVLLCLRFSLIPLSAATGYSAGDFTCRVAGAGAGFGGKVGCAKMDTIFIGTGRV